MASKSCDGTASSLSGLVSTVFCLNRVFDRSTSSTFLSLYRVSLRAYGSFWLDSFVAIASLRSSSSYSFTSWTTLPWGDPEDEWDPPNIFSNCWLLRCSFIWYVDIFFTWLLTAASFLMPGDLLEFLAEMWSDWFKVWGYCIVKAPLLGCALKNYCFGMKLPTIPKLL